MDKLTYKKAVQIYIWYIRKYGFDKGRNLARQELRNIYGISSKDSGHSIQVHASTKQIIENSKKDIINYHKTPNQSLQQLIHDAFWDWRKYKGVVLAPVAYDLSLKQRPDHLMKCLADDGYLCIMVEKNSKASSIVSNANGVFITNIWDGVFSYFMKENPILYIHYPFFGYFTEIIDRPFVIYDVLDDYSIFSGDQDELSKRHNHLLKTADISIFSSRPLLEANAKVTRNPILVENGVWAEDFRKESSSRDSSEITRVGYHGVLSELLDIELLFEIANIPNVKLILVGPIAAFDPKHLSEVEERYAELTKRDNVEYLGKIPYDEVKDYLGKIDIGIVPFVASRGTDGVSPLKLFEFMAAGKPILALPTKTVNEYSDIIDVCPAEKILDKIRNQSWTKPGSAGYETCLTEHEWPYLTRTLIEQLASGRKTYPAVPVSHSKRVDIINVNFFDWDGEVLYRGGAERYVYDLCVIAQSLGMEPRIIQNGRKDFQRTFRGVPVIGVRTDIAWDTRQLSPILSDATAGAGLVIASPLDLACGVNQRQPVIGINHGIYWDSIENNHQYRSFDTNIIIDAIQRCRHTVCVDTNFINWVRTIDWSLGRNLHYVPNYVKSDTFYPKEKNFSAEKLRVLMPRRLYEPRGLYMAIEAFDSLFKTRGDLHLTLCGQATGDDVAAVKSFMSRHDGKVDWIERDMDEMGDVYRDHEIVLIPTLASEGTSLSCVEAFASNCAVIATNVGGLPNLLQDHYNGLMIRPIAKDMEDAISRLADDRQWAEQIASIALQTVKTYDFTVWQARWEKLLKSAIW
ncbi:glycosyltransferase [Ochrobactrum sp. 3-3]|uniref:glycosyltransferase n=1 Tax=Ochrobactrum sp. 3-3 TaxID=1830124 RepID=UPI000DEFA37A|nr:glycosyltransferase [Ochrobactrum sp. 3-3]